tara:strand:+ start:10725 stop:10868 length:144 start_codon:yes stop_codon:yes gene_type:complete
MLIKTPRFKIKFDKYKNKKKEGMLKGGQRKKPLVNLELSSTPLPSKH